MPPEGPGRGCAQPPPPNSDSLKHFPGAQALVGEPVSFVVRRVTTAGHCAGGTRRLRTLSHPALPLAPPGQALGALGSCPPELRPRNRIRTSVYASLWVAAATDSAPQPPGPGRCSSLPGGAPREQELPRALGKATAASPTPIATESRAPGPATRLPCYGWDRWSGLPGRALNGTARLRAQSVALPCWAGTRCRDARRSGPWSPGLKVALTPQPLLASREVLCLPVRLPATQLAGAAPGPAHSPFLEPQSPVTLGEVGAAPATPPGGPGSPPEASCSTPQLWSARAWTWACGR